MAQGSPPTVPAAVSRCRLVVVVAIGVLASASAPLLIKATPVPALQLASTRLLLAAVLLAPFAIMAARRAPEFGLKRWLHAAWPPGLLIGLHFATWNAGVTASATADAALIGNLGPLVLPFMLAAVASERISRRELAATLIALCGLAFRWSAGAPTVGDSLCLLAMILYAAYLALGRRNRRLPSVWPYIALVYTIGGIACALLSLVTERWSPPTPRVWLGIAALALFPTILGHSIANWAVRHVRGQVVSLVYLLAAPLSGIYAYLAWNELPGPGWRVTFAGMTLALVVLAVPLPSWASGRHPRDVERAR